MSGKKKKKKNVFMLNKEKGKFLIRRKINVDEKYKNRKLIGGKIKTEVHFLSSIRSKRFKYVSV